MKSKIHSIPSSPVADSLYKTFAGCTELERMMNNATEIITMEDKNGNKKIVIENESHKAEITIKNFDRFLKANKTIKKVFLFLLVKTSQQAFFNHQLTQNYIQFHISELVDIGCYEHISSAVRGLKEAMYEIESLQIGGGFNLSGKRISTTIAVPFYQTKIKNNICTIGLADFVNWDLFFSFFTYVPEYYFQATSKAADLILYIMYLSRQRTKILKEKGEFNISVAAIVRRLNLPEVHETKNPKRDIKDVLDNTFKEVEELSEGNVKIICPEQFKKVSDFVEQGYVTIQIKGEIQKKFSKIAKS